MPKSSLLLVYKSDGGPNLNTMLKKWMRIKFILGRDVQKRIVTAGLAGTFTFFVDIAFIVVLQGFLFSIDLVDSTKLNLPTWYPKDYTSSILILLAFGLIRSFALMLKHFLSGQASQEFIYKIRSELLNHGLYLGAEVSTHELVSVFTESVNRAGLVVYLFITIVINLFSITFLVIYGLSLAPAEMLIGLLCLGILVFPLTFMNKEVGKMGRGLNVEWKNTSKSLIEGIKLNFYLKVYGLLGKAFSEGDESLDSYRRHYVKFYFKNAIRHGLPPFLGICILSAITYVGLHLFNTPSIILLTFFYLFIRLGQLLSEFATYVGNLQLNFEGMKDLEVWLQKYRPMAKQGTVTETVSPGLVFDTTKELTITANNLSFRYGYEEYLFKNINFRLLTGDCLVIRGESGVGKSSLLALLLGVLKPTEGNVLYNSMSVSETRGDIVRSIGYVGPDPYLVAGTLRENLFLGHPFPDKVSAENIENALRISELVEVVGSLKSGMDTYLNENVKLSTGQKQRIAIARALLRNPKILVLDEATANLDEMTESLIIENLKKISNSLILIIISHKTSFDPIATQTIHLQRM